MFRHGARTPVKSYPKDIYHEDSWSKFGGYGQLTQTGMRQHFAYGQFLKDRYSQFLNKTYDRRRVQIRSTDYDRTLMSAYSLLAGLFEPFDYQKWNNDLNWQPIPVHTTELKNDKIFYSNDCPKLKDLRAQVRQTPEYIEMNKQFEVNNRIIFFFLYYKENLLNNKTFLLGLVQSTGREFWLQRCEH